MVFKTDVGLAESVPGYVDHDLNISIKDSKGEVTGKTPRRKSISTQLLTLQKNSN